MLKTTMKLAYGKIQNRFGKVLNLRPLVHAANNTHLDHQVSNSYFLLQKFVIQRKKEKLKEILLLLLFVNLYITPSKLQK